MLSLPISIMHIRHQSLSIGAVAFLLVAQLTHGRQPRPSRRLDDEYELGKFMDGPATEIDCSKSTTGDFEYYIERCYDSETQWWINGHCKDGVKTEISELHLCMKPDGARPYCRDCNDGRGNVKNVCGSDSDDYDFVCKLALASSAEDCGDDGLTVYSHQCVPSYNGPGTQAWYLRESFYCEESEVYEGNDDTITCGQEWFYPFEYDPDNPWLDVGNGHPFSTASNKYCLDCGMAIQICAADGDATCESLGLPPKGMSETPVTTPEITTAATVVVTTVDDATTTTTTTTAGTDSPDATTTGATDATTEVAATTNTDATTSDVSTSNIAPTDAPAPATTQSSSESPKGGGAIVGPPPTALVGLLIILSTSLLYWS